MTGSDTLRLEAFRALCSGPHAPRVPGGERVDVSELVTADPPPPGATAGGAEPPRYRAAADAFRQWRRDGLLTPDGGPARWVLEVRPDTDALAAGGPDAPRVAVGLLGGLLLDDRVVAHEAVRPDLVAARAARLAAVPVDLSPVTIFPAAPLPGLGALFDDVRDRPADLTVRDEIGTTFSLWRLDASPGPGAVLPAEARLIVADGHHRVAAARLAGAGARTLACVLASPPASRPVHRLLLPDDAAALDAALHRLFDVRTLPSEPGDGASATGGPGDVARRTRHLADRVAADPEASFGLIDDGGTAALLIARHPTRLRADVPVDRPPQWRALDAALWEHGVRPRLDRVRQRAVGDDGELATALDTPGARLVVLPAVETATVVDLALAGALLPPKVTWFSPKPRTGLIARPAT